MEKKPYPSETQERFIVRFPDGMRDRIAETAKEAGRSMNAEIVARLQSSFEGDKSLSEGVRLAVESAAEDWNVSFEEALERAVFGGVSPNAPQVIVIRPSGHMTVAEMKKLFEASKDHVSPNATVIFERG